MGRSGRTDFTMPAGAAPEAIPVNVTKVGAVNRLVLKGEALDAPREEPRVPSDDERLEAPGWMRTLGMSSCQDWIALEDRDRRRAARDAFGSDGNRIAGELDRWCEDEASVRRGEISRESDAATVAAIAAEEHYRTAPWRSARSYDDFDREIGRFAPPPDEVRATLTDFRIFFETSGVNPCLPTRSTPATEVQMMTRLGANVSNLFSFFRWVRIQRNILPWNVPVVPATSVSDVAHLDLYGFLRDLSLSWYFSPVSSAMALGCGHAMTFGLAGISNTDLPDIAAIALHEVRHTIPGGNRRHPCESEAMRRARIASGGRFVATDTCDPTLSFGGAYAVEYRYWESLLRYSKPGQFDARHWLCEARMREILRNKICDPTQ